MELWNEEEKKPQIPPNPQQILDRYIFERDTEIQLAEVLISAFREQKDLPDLQI